MKVKKTTKATKPSGKFVKPLELEDFIKLQPGENISGYFQGFVKIRNKDGKISETPKISEDQAGTKQYGLPSHATLVNLLKKDEIKPPCYVEIFCRKEAVSEKTGNKYFEYEVYVTK